MGYQALCTSIDLAIYAGPAGYLIYPYICTYLPQRPGAHQCESRWKGSWEDHEKEGRGSKRVRSARFMVDACLWGYWLFVVSNNGSRPRRDAGTDIDIRTEQNRMDAFCDKNIKTDYYMVSTVE